MARAASNEGARGRSRTPRARPPQVERSVPSVAPPDQAPAKDTAPERSRSPAPPEVDSARAPARTGCDLGGCRPTQRAPCPRRSAGSASARRLPSRWSRRRRSWRRAGARARRPRRTRPSMPREEVPAPAAPRPTSAEPCGRFGPCPGCRRWRSRFRHGKSGRSGPWRPTWRGTRSPRVPERRGARE